MNKLAIFVEGQTEQFFVRKLLREIGGKGKIRMEPTRASRGKRGNRVITMEASHVPAGEGYFVLIVDCGADNRVKSDVGDQYDGLAKSGYNEIIAIRDVYPEVKPSEIRKLREGLQDGMKTKPIPVLFVLAVMEIEAWFIAEHTHFASISPNLTMPCIKAKLGFDPSTDDMQTRSHPSKDLNDIYSLAGSTYHKSRAEVQRTVRVLDYARIYLELGQKFPDLQEALNCIDRFLSPSPSA